MGDNIGGFFTTLGDNISQWFDNIKTDLNNYFEQKRIEREEDKAEKEREKAEKKAQEEREKQEQENKENEGSTAINNAVSSITDKFDFIDNVKTNVNDMVDVITDETRAPKFEINVNSKWYSGTVTVIDFSFYDDFRDYGDIVICMFCYLGFLWRVFMRLPDIIQGAGATSYFIDNFADIYYLSEGHKR